MSKERESALRAAKIDEVKDPAFGDWLTDLEEKEQPTCNIDNPDDCEACGS